eukprot:COSAG01_NODE_2533_length_7491_cov_236.560741_3_plen_199_part_00
MPSQVEEVEQACQELAAILEKYQLQPALLDPHLERILAQLFVPVKAAAAAAGEAKLAAAAVPPPPTPPGAGAAVGAEDGSSDSAEARPFARLHPALRAVYVLAKVCSPARRTRLISRWGEGMGGGTRCAGGDALGLAASAAAASFVAAVVTDIYLCDVCSCQEILRRGGGTQVRGYKTVVSLKRRLVESPWLQFTSEC